VTGVPDPVLLRKSGSAENQTWDLWICSQELWSYTYIIIFQDWSSYGEIKAAHLHETSINVYKNTRRHIPDDRILF
jgi:hypothetical protein